MNAIKINHGAVWVSIVWMFILGFLWYGPLLGETWMGLVGMTMEQAEANPPSVAVWISNIVASAAAIYFLAWLFVQMNVQSLMKGLILGVLLGFLFNLLPTMINGFYADAPYGLAWITGGFQCVGWGVSGIILGSWTKSA